MLAGFLDMQTWDKHVPCTLDVLLQMCCLHLAYQRQYLILKRSQKVVKWCERQLHARPSLPVFDMEGIFPKLLVPRELVNHAKTNVVVPDAVECIAETLAISLQYVESVQGRGLLHAADVSKQFKPLPNKSLRKITVGHAEMAAEWAPHIFTVLVKGETYFENMIFRCLSRSCIRCDSCLFYASCEDVASESHIPSMWL